MNISESYVIEQYVKHRRSAQDIANELGTYPNRVLRILRKAGRPIRDYSKAQKAALKSGRKEHPTKGKTLSSNTKLLISEKVAKCWAELTPNDRASRTEKLKAAWEAMDAVDKANFHHKAHIAIRKAAEHGSALEKAVKSILQNLGCVVQSHVQSLIANTELEVDLFLPDLGLVVEVDGPSHFLPIWGADKLLKQQKADSEKTALLQNKGYRVLRIKNLKSNISQKRLRTASKMLEVYLHNISPYAEIEL
jgi:very-short-patch-repair endonuclease